MLVFGVLTGTFSAGYGVMFTVLDDFRDEYGIADSSLGAIISIGFFSSFVAQVFLAPLADRGYARRLVFTGTGLMVVSLVAMAFGTTAGVLLIARFVMGLGEGLGLPAIRRIVILRSPDELGRSMGTLLAANVTGFAIGPAVSAVLVGPFGIAAPFLLVAVCVAACLPIVARVRVDESDRSAHTQARFAFDLLRVRPYLGALCLGAAVFLMIGTFDALWVLVLDDLGTADWIANLGIVLFAVPLVLFGSAGGRLAQRVGPFRVGSFGLFAASIFMFLYGQLPSGAALFTVSLFHAVNDGLTVSAAGVAVGMVAPAERQAGAQGLLGGVQTLIGGVSALVAGVLYEQSGRALAYSVCAGAIVILATAGRFLGRGDAGAAEHVDLEPAGDR
ncbi:MAG: hypothetical protein RI958_3202 [Actinomycetota bacterium]